MLLALAASFFRKVGKLDMALNAAKRAHQIEPSYNSATQLVRHVAMGRRRRTRLTDNRVFFICRISLHLPSTSVSICHYLYLYPLCS